MWALSEALQDAAQSPCLTPLSLSLPAHVLARWSPFAALDAQIVGRVRRTCQNGAYIPPAAFGMRKHFFTYKGGVSVSGSDAPGSGASSKVAEKVAEMAAASGDTFLLTLKPRTKDSLGLLRDTENLAGAPANPMMTNPDGMMGPMKKQMAMQMPYMIMMSFISYLFSGFVIAKIPFYLPTSFRLMVQRGVNIGGLDVTYVSSLSWYFLAMFGLQGVYYLLLGANSGCVAVSRVGGGAARLRLAFSRCTLARPPPLLQDYRYMFANPAHHLTRVLPRYILSVTLPSLARPRTLLALSSRCASLALFCFSRLSLSPLPERTERTLALGRCR